ncbi:MAG: tyrosine--tRNA ligase [Deltaproteobacteria bacterium HGW-Deltaproteobacteria-19]|jgi:tyrosyl-tRNA synthetase|nr:MAG: tyrosine--tRNA ligase [Deltaproteobacteria bacterium HGW-Deltaproteobacteria-19]
MKNVYDVFLERGFLEQVTDEGQVRELLGSGPVTGYIGFDPTATSLHVGSLVPIMALVHLQRCGHRPIALVGGGTGLIGDPSGKTEMRRVLTREEIDSNAGCLRTQLSHYLDFGEGKALLVNNTDWLTELNYIAFLRDIGRHFSVNKMLTAESYRLRLEKGLSFIEFNYMLLQAYDFLYLFKNLGCEMQFGGNDQWGNMLAGVDLIRRVEGRQAHSLTFPLMTTAQGHKMGKTEKGTVWLDGTLTSPYEYFQYWINADDADVARFLALFTFLPMEEVRQAETLSGAQLNMAKAVLAFEATRITHSPEEAVAAWNGSAAAFHLKPVDQELFPSSEIPRTVPGEDLAAIPTIGKDRAALETGVSAFDLFHESGLCASKGEAKRVLSQGGGYVNDRPVRSPEEKIGLGDANERGEIRLRKGKKSYAVIRILSS